MTLSGCSPESVGRKGTETGTGSALSNDQSSSGVLLRTDEPEGDGTTADSSTPGGGTDESAGTNDSTTVKDAKDNAAGNGTEGNSGSGTRTDPGADAVSSDEAGSGAGVSDRAGFTESAKPDIAPDVAERIIKQTAEKIIRAIAGKDFETVSEYTHPELGVRFTPYTCPSEENDLVFSKEMIKEFFDDKNTYVWGYYDGSGFDIELTPEGYYREFIYPVDFANVQEVGYNTVLSNTVMYENQFEFYRNSIIVEYYYPGTQQNDGMDWKSLRLVFQQYGGSWLLTGIISNQWTI
mgnify:CR=1 FL=1